MNRVGFIASSLLVILALASSMLFVVDQRQFGVVYALGQIKDVVTEPGLHFKLPPPFQNVSYIDKRLLTLDSVDAEPMLTAEKQRESFTGGVPDVHRQELLVSKTGSKSIVIPAKAGIQFDLPKTTWVPAFAGTTILFIFATLCKNQLRDLAFGKNSCCPSTLYSAIRR